MDTERRPADLATLFHGAFRGLRRRWSEQLAPYGLRPAQWRALNTLAHAPGGLRLKDLAGQLGIAPRSATEVVDQLEERGLVRRAGDPADRRATLVAATADGHALWGRIGAARRRGAEAYFAHLTPADRAELARILARLADPGAGGRAADAGPEADARPDPEAAGGAPGRGARTRDAEGPGPGPDRGTPARDAEGPRPGPGPLGAAR